MMDSQTRQMISYGEALEILNTIWLKALPTEKIVFNQSLGRILARDIKAKRNVPSAPTSAMDGFAVRFDDIVALQKAQQQAQKKGENLEWSDGLKIQACNQAGSEELYTLESESTIRTYTGSRMPLDSDTLLLVEDVEEFEKDGESYIRLKDAGQMLKRAQWVRQVGDNYKKDEILIHKGTRISPFEIGILADNNEVFIEVFARARVGILSIGDEIIEVGEESNRTNALRSVNNHLLGALVETLGHTSVLFPKVGDDKEAIRRLYKNALEQCDVLITTGGMSVGDFDFTKEIMKQECKVVFKGVRLKPGKPVAYGIYSNTQKQTHVFGLPGYPNSCAATFLLFVRVILARLCETKASELILNATLLEDLKRTDSRMEFRACEVRVESGALQVSCASKKSLQSSMINNLGAHTAFIVLEENGGDLPKGASVKVLLFRDILG